MVPRSAVCPLALAAVLLGARVAGGSTPIFPNGAHVDADHAYALADVDLSRRLMVEIGCPPAPFFASFEGAPGEQVRVMLGVPRIASLRGYRPTVAVVGPGLPDPGALPFAVPAGSGAIELRADDATTPPTLEDPSSGTSSWVLVDESLTVPARGTYDLVVYDPEAHAGRFWLGVGSRDDAASGPDRDAALARVRRFHEPTDDAALGLPCAGSRSKPGDLAGGVDGGCAVAAPGHARPGPIALVLAAAALALRAAAGRRRRRTSAPR